MKISRVVLLVLGSSASAMADETTNPKLRGLQPNSDNANANGNGANIAAYDCHSTGCSMSRKDMGPLVCGKDGNTYWNECLAVCQGVEIEKNGACPGQMDDFIHDNFDETSRADLATMNRFKAEGFKLVAKRKSVNHAQLEVGEDEVGADDLLDDATPGNGIGKIRMNRLSNDLFEYVAELDEDSMPGNAPDFPPGLVDNTPVPNVLEPEDRKLWVFSPDERYELRYPYSFPNRLHGRTAIGCSGTVIGRDAVITAGHCIYSNGSWRDGDFTPAQFRTSSNSIVKPYGKWDWRHMTTYTGWTRDGNWAYDIAVVRFHPQSTRGDIGTYLGYAGLRQVSYASSYLDYSTTSGYPSDKSNQELWKSPCGTTWYKGSSNYIADHKCDITNGNSGGSFIDSNGYVMGVQSHHRNDGSINGAVILYGNHYHNVLKWAGRV